MSREAMQQAIEALEHANQTMSMEFSEENYYGVEIAALRQALDVNMNEERVDETVKCKHEPVAWANLFDLQNFDMKVRTCPDLHHTVPLYTAPPKQWVGLTDEEIAKVISGQFAEQNYWVKITRAIEAKLKEKNG